MVRRRDFRTNQAHLSDTSCRFQKDQQDQSAPHLPTHLPLLWEHAGAGRVELSVAAEAAEVASQLLFCNAQLSHGTARNPWCSVSTTLGRCETPEQGWANHLTGGATVAPRI